MCPARARIVGARAAGSNYSIRAGRFDGCTAAISHAAAGGPRGRESASTVAGAKRQATSGHSAFEISYCSRSNELLVFAKDLDGEYAVGSQGIRPADRAAANTKGELRALRGQATLCCRSAGFPTLLILANNQTRGRPVQHYDPLEAHDREEWVRTGAAS
jgi:hypothetical protein